MNKQILVLDIDGTLTNSQKIITEPTKQALFAMQEAGKTVIIASGRPTKGTAPLSDALRLSDYGGYVLSYNGERVVHMSTAAHAWKKQRESLPMLLHHTAKFRQQKELMNSISFCAASLHSSGEEMKELPLLSWKNMQQPTVMQQMSGIF